MLNIFNYLAKGTEKPISVLLTLTANSVHVMMLRIPYSEPIFQYGPKFSQNTLWYSLTYYHGNVLVLPWYPTINCLTFLYLNDLEPCLPAKQLFFATHLHLLQSYTPASSCTELLVARSTNHLWFTRSTTNCTTSTTDCFYVPGMMRSTLHALSQLIFNYPICVCPI